MVFVFSSNGTLLPRQWLTISLLLGRTELILFAFAFSVELDPWAFSPSSLSPHRMEEAKDGWVFGCWLRSAQHSAPVPNKHCSLCFPAWDYVIPLLLHFHLLLHFPSHSISFQIIVPIRSDHPHQNSWLFLQSWLGMAPLKTLNLTKWAFSFQREFMETQPPEMAETNTGFLL